MDATAVALIADIIGSRSLVSRERAQQDVLTAFRRSEQFVAPPVRGYATVGDEFQAVYDDVQQAIVASTIVLLALPDELELRLGIGVGTDRVVSTDGGTAIRDGDAWWNAREAIDNVKRAERGARSAAHTGFVDPQHPGASVVRAALLLRDHVVAAMNSRERRIALAGLEGTSQQRTADSEGITQSAVSQSWRRSGAISLVEMLHALREEPR